MSILNRHVSIANNQPAAFGYPYHRRQILGAFLGRCSADVRAYADDLADDTGLWLATIDHALRIMLDNGEITRDDREDLREPAYYLTATQFAVASQQVDRDGYPLPATVS